jgi:hypothetical protein
MFFYMHIDYISKREVRVPTRGPSTLHNLLDRTQESLRGTDELDSVRLLHDSLAFLTEFFASFAVGAFRTVGPLSPSVEQLLAQPHTQDRSERLLAQAFLDWKAYPHHPAYESLREIFFLTSRLQSSRYAPRRHTRWLGVEGKPINGLESLGRWSRRLDLAIKASDREAAKSYLGLYTPLLWTWSDALDHFFNSWSFRVAATASDGKLSLSGSASKDDVRLDLIPAPSLPGLKSLFIADGNGGALPQGFSDGPLAPDSHIAPPMLAPSIAAEPQLVFDPASGEYKSVETVSAHPNPSPPGEPPLFAVEGLSPGEPTRGAGLDEPAVSGLFPSTAPEFADPVAQDVTKGSEVAPVDFVQPAVIDFDQSASPAPVQAAVPEFTQPVPVQPVEPISPPRAPVENPLQHPRIQRLCRPAFPFQRRQLPPPISLRPGCPKGSQMFLSRN